MIDSGVEGAFAATTTATAAARLCPAVWVRSTSYHAAENYKANVLSSKQSADRSWNLRWWRTSGWVFLLTGAYAPPSPSPPTNTALASPLSILPCHRIYGPGVVPTYLGGSMDACVTRDMHGPDTRVFRSYTSYDGREAPRHTGGARSVVDARSGVCVPAEAAGDSPGEGLCIGAATCSACSQDPCASIGWGYAHRGVKVFRVVEQERADALLVACGSLSLQQNRGLQMR